MRIALSFARRHAALLLALGAWGLALLFIQPLRECSMDDDWAYALTAKHLFETGEYRLNDWLAANIPFQAYWGVAFCRMLGYSFSALRLSTLTLVLVGALALYGLAREHRLGRRLSGTLVLVMLGSPLVVRFSLSFMSDAPFLSTVLLAMFLYTRAIRLRSVGWMVAASLAAAAAILVRQFGVALLAGLFSLWLLDARCRRRPLLFLAGAVLPFLAVGWQVRAGALAPNWAAQYVKSVQASYLRDTGALLSGFLWRPAIILQYLAFFTVPLVLLGGLRFSERTLGPKPIARWIGAVSCLCLVAVGAYMVSWQFRKHVVGGWPAFETSEKASVLTGMLLLVTSTWFCAGLLCTGGGQVLQRRQGQPVWRTMALVVVLALYVACGMACTGSWLMPLLPWSLEELQYCGLPTVIALTVITSLGGVLVGWFFLRRCAGWRSLPAHTKFLDVSTVFLLGAHLIFFKIGDEYLLDLLPFTLVMAGRSLRALPVRHQRALILVGLGVLLLSANWVRACLDRAEASWCAAETLRAKGIAVDDIHGDWKWVCYYRFDEYVASMKDRRIESLNDLFGRWLPNRRECAKYKMAVEFRPPDGEKWDIVAETTFRDSFFRVHRVQMVCKGSP
jgi:hypothetical protein